MKLDAKFFDSFCRLQDAVFHCKEKDCELTCDIGMLMDTIEYMEKNNCFLSEAYKHVLHKTIPQKEQKKIINGLKKNCKEYGVDLGKILGRIAERKK